LTKKLKANAFSSEVSTWLNARTRFGKNLEWKPDHRLDRSGRDFVDVVGIVRSHKLASILVEIELHREDPVSNVVKIWKWAEDKKGGRILFFHAFSKLYAMGKSERKKRAVFLGRMLEKETAVRYIPIDLKYSPRPGGRFGAGRRTRAAHLLARRIMNQLVKMGFASAK
jgi:hypothetical protein